MSTWLLLRGLTREVRHWQDFPVALQAALVPHGEPAVAVRLIELPGNGVRNGERTPASVVEIMHAVRQEAMQSASGLTGPVCLLAMSLGAMVATAWAQHYPGEVQRLVLINTSMRPWCGITQRLRPTAWPAVARLAARWSDAQACEQTIHCLTCRRTERRAEDIRVWQAIRRSAPVSAANGVRQLWAAARYRADRAAPACPVLLLSGAADRLVNPLCSARIAAHWGAEHRAHPWAGHDLPHDDATWLCDTVSQWCAPRL